MRDMSAVRVLVVDESAEWQAFVMALLRGSGVLAIDVASSALAAMPKAQEMQPTLVLMDIRLPDQNGVEAARQIRALAPQARIIFVSNFANLFVFQGAGERDRRGNLQKWCAPSELLMAVHLALQGPQ